MDKQRLSTALNDARYDERFKMPGYTGHVNGLMEVYASTPVHAAVRHSFHHIHSTAPHPPSRPRRLRPTFRFGTLYMRASQAHPAWRDGQTRRSSDILAIYV
jgi:hypothetical protein